jgi:hypothetical protein
VRFLPLLPSEGQGRETQETCTRSRLHAGIGPATNILTTNGGHSMKKAKITDMTRSEVLQGSYKTPQGGIVLDFEQLGWNFCSFGPTRTNRRQKRDTWVVKCRDGSLKFVSDWESEVIFCI